MKAISWIFRKLTQNEFKAITDQIQSEGGGSQTYIDLPKGKISDDNLTDFFGAGVDQGPNKGYKWTVPVCSLALDMPSQNVVISQRRDSSNCIREQNKEKRINIWKSEYSNFPTDNYDESQNPIYVFIVKSSEGRFYAGWFYSSAYQEKWFVTKDLCKPFFGESAGYDVFNTPIEFDGRDYNWPFRQLSTEDESSSLPDLHDDIRDSLTGKVIRAIRTKPFVLLAGISGTGKSRIVRQLARACWPVGSDEAKAHKPSNYEMVQVKPNWHDSSELLGYVSRISDKPEFIAGDFLKFIAKAWENPKIPYFLCLDEMNLAPVEQYFAEYLSVVESRKLQDDGRTILTDPILKKESGKSENGVWYQNLCNTLTENETLQHQFLYDGISIPQNLIVVGTVNMDETTYSFSRKVLDRAMTIEMNEVNLRGGLHKEETVMPFIPANNMLADAVEGYDVYPDNESISENVLSYLGDINDVLANTPFRVAYRTRNEFLIYVVNAIRLAGEGTDQYKVVANALDEVTSMKILSRIEGDKRKVDFLPKLKDTIKKHIDLLGKEDHTEMNSVSIAKLNTMIDRLRSGYTSFWD